MRLGMVAAAAAALWLGCAQRHQDANVAGDAATAAGGDVLGTTTDAAAVGAPDTQLAPSDGEPESSADTGGAEDGKAVCQPPMDSDPQCVPAPCTEVMGALIDRARLCNAGMRYFACYPWEFVTADIKCRVQLSTGDVYGFPALAPMAPVPLPGWGFCTTAEQKDMSGAYSRPCSADAGD